MGRLLLLLLLIAAVVFVAYAFRPQWFRSRGSDAEPEPRIKGPDDDDEFLWQLKKEQFKKRRERGDDPEGNSGRA